MFNRRHFLTHAAGLIAATAAGRRLWAAGAPLPPTSITVYKSSTCGCCAKWVDHLKANGFAPAVHDDEQMDAIKDQLGIPKGVRSCHTAIVGRYFIEGHVPASDIHRLISEQPKVAGLAVPGMPGGTPGMLEPGAAPQPYEVVAFKSGGETTLYARH
ncbi:MAG: DUF411 domain-containing protein [Gemmatimonadales bacterium]